MATSWVLGKITDAIQPTVYNAASTAGGYAGGALSSVGSGINGIGSSINGTIKRYGDGIVDYGNGVKDWSNASGPRAATAQNPLGLSGSSVAGKSSVTSPSIYSAPSSASKTLTTTAKTQKKGAGNSVKKPTPKPVTGSQPLGAKKAVTGAPAKAPSVKPNVPVGNAAKGPTAVKKPATAVKASTAGVTKAKPPSAIYKPNSGAASNPLGLSF